MSPGVVPKPTVSGGDGFDSPMSGGSGAPLSVTGNLDTLAGEFDVQKQMMDFMNDKVSEFLNLSAIRTQLISVATQILQIFLQPLSMLNPGELDPSGVFEGLDKVMQTMGGVSNMLSDASNGVQDIVSTAEGLSGNTSDRMREMADSQPDNTVEPFKNKSQYGIGYAGGFESSNESIDRVTDSSIQMGVDVQDFKNSLKQNRDLLNQMVVDFKSTAAEIKEVSKEVTESTDSVKDFVNNLDTLNRAVLAIVAVLAVPPPTWGLATLFLSFDTGVLEWVKSIMAELQEIQEMINSMSNTMEAMQQQMEQPMSRLGIPYGG